LLIQQHSKQSVLVRSFLQYPNPMNRLGVRTDEFNSPSYFVHDINVPTAPISAAVRTACY
jgi:hypothetical protein